LRERRPSPKSELLVSYSRFVLHDSAECISAAALKSLKYQCCFGAGEGIRTLDPNLGKVVLLQGRAALAEDIQACRARRPNGGVDG
jgi:hypothetical protein